MERVDVAAATGAYQDWLRTRDIPRPGVRVNFNHGDPVTAREHQQRMQLQIEEMIRMFDDLGVSVRRQPPTVHRNPFETLARLTEARPLDNA